MKSYVPLAFAAGVVLGALGAFTATAWRRGGHEGTYCVRCAMHRDTWGRHTRERGGALHALLASSAGAHAHVWADATGVRDADQRALQREAVSAEFDDLDAIERDPAAIATLVEAWRDDRERAARFTRLVINPDGHVDRAALGLLQRPEMPWADRWRVVDGFHALYRCLSAPAAVTCSLPVGPVTVIAWHQVPGSLLRGPIPWTTWTPPNFAPSVRLTPIAPPIVAPPIVAPPTTPEPPAPPVEAAAGDASVEAPSPPDSRSVERGIALANRGQVEAAARELARLQRMNPPPAGLSRLRDAIRQRAVAQIDELILSARCNDAQRLARQLRSLGCAVDARDHFGSACPSPQ